MNQNRIEEIMGEEKLIFINSVSRELEKKHAPCFDNFGFPCYGKIEDAYYEQVYFQSYLESFTRKLMNGILKQVAEEESFASLIWPEYQLACYNGYQNTEYEKEYRFELVDSDSNTGYRYTLLPADEEERELFFKKANVGKVIIVDWGDFDCICYDDSRVEIVTPRDFFEMLLTDEAEDELEWFTKSFDECIADAVKQATKIISLRTVPGFTPQYLYHNRGSMLRDIEKRLSEISFYYVKNKDYKINESNSKNFAAKYHSLQDFVKNKHHYCLTGENNYAKSFLTSEYLYRQFKKNPLFDFTPIVSGYIKAVEQLLREICQCYHLKYQSEEEFSLKTMGDYIENLKCIRVFKRVVVPDKRTIIACLHSYRAECRNNLFHTDSFDEWDWVNTIRDNTLFLFAVLIESLDLKTLNKNWSWLGIADENYTNLFKFVEESRDTCYRLVFQNAVISGARKKERQEGMQFSRSGLIVSAIPFYYFGFDEYKEITISPENMPREIWILEHQGKSERCIWKNNILLADSLPMNP